MRIDLTHTAVLLVVAGLISCSSEQGASEYTSETGGTGAVAATGGASTGGNPAMGGTSTLETGGMPASGGLSPTGGAAASGGSSPTGGAAGSGGSSPTGGMAGSGGSTPTGGAAGSGGLAPTGGAAGSGGLTPTGGAAGSGGQQTGVEAGSGGVSTGGAAPSGGASGGGPLPPVYDVEDTGADCPEPSLPSFNELPSISYLPDPFLMTSGSRITTRADWRCRRAEIKAQLEYYDVGEKPGRPSTFNATLQGSTISITVGEGGNTATITATISRPGGAPDGPIPAVIGIGSGTGSIPSDLFSTRGIASISFDPAQLAPVFSGGRSDGEFYGLYPGTTAGFMIRWAWGVSRIIDALEQLPEANIDLSRLAVTGCSYAGKVALYAGAFDERIALTLPHESGGGGTISWRYSDMLEDRDNTEVENLHHALGAPWYAEMLAQFVNSPDKLPFDHHELIAMVAPRAFLAIESTAIARMGAEAARVDALAAREVWTALGVPDRMGATEENTDHCVWHAGFTPDVEAHLDKFLLGQENVDTDILCSRFNVDTATWIPWDTPVLQ